MNISYFLKASSVSRVNRALDCDKMMEKKSCHLMSFVASRQKPLVPRFLERETEREREREREMDWNTDMNLIMPDNEHVGKAIKTFFFFVTNRG